MGRTDYAAFTDIIRGRISAEELGKDYGLKVGRDGRCPCIFCDGQREDTLRLYPEDRGFYCFRCHQRGDVIALYMQLTGCGFRQAVEGLNDQYGLGLPLDGGDPQAEARARQEAEKRRAERARREAETHRMLELYWDAADAVQILEENRAELAPGSPEEPMRQRFVVALKYLDEMRAWRDWLFDQVYGTFHFLLQKQHDS